MSKSVPGPREKDQALMDVQRLAFEIRLPAIVVSGWTILEREATWERGGQKRAA